MRSLEVVPGRRTVRAIAAHLSIAAVLLVAGLCGRAASASAEAVIVYGYAGRFDKSFNEAAFWGARQSGQPFSGIEPKAGEDLEVALTKAANTGDLVLAVGFAFADPMARVAKANPNTRFIIIDGAVAGPNVQAIAFKEHEGSYLAGVAAALASRTGTIGFVGGMEVPLIHRFRVGFEEGARATRPNIRVLTAFAGKTPAAFADPFVGGEISGVMIDEGADVMFAAAGTTGLGVYAAAKAERRLAIGVDSNQNDLYPGTMLTSMMKRVDVAVRQALERGVAGFKPGTLILGLAEGGVELAIDTHNAALITPEIKAAIDTARTGIIGKSIVVTDAMQAR